MSLNSDQQGAEPNGSQIVLMEGMVNSLPNFGPIPKSSNDCSTAAMDKKYLDSDDLMKLWKSFESLALDMRSSDGEILPAQKILADTSPVLYTLFESATKNEVKVEGISKYTLQVVLEFLYTGILNKSVSMEEVANLLKAAEKYQIEKLTQRLFSHLMSCLNIHNAGKIVVLVHTYKASAEIKSQLQEFLLGERIWVSQNVLFQEMVKQYPLAFAEIMFGVFDN